MVLLCKLFLFSPFSALFLSFFLLHLVDSQLNAKIADLDLGYQYDASTLMTSDANPTTVGAGATGDGNNEEPEFGVDVENALNTALNKVSLQQQQNQKNAPVQVGGSNMCIYWQAPEVQKMK